MLLRSENTATGSAAVGGLAPLGRRMGSTFTVSNGACRRRRCPYPTVQTKNRVNVGIQHRGGARAVARALTRASKSANSLIKARLHCRKASLLSNVLPYSVGRNHPGCGVIGVAVSAGDGAVAVAVVVVVIVVPRGRLH